MHCSRKKRGVKIMYMYALIWYKFDLTSHASKGHVTTYCTYGNHTVFRNFFDLKYQIGGPRVVLNASRHVFIMVSFYFLVKSSSEPVRVNIKQKCLCTQNNHVCVNIINHGLYLSVHIDSLVQLKLSCFV